MSDNAKLCTKCNHDGSMLDAGGYCNELVIRDGHGDTCGCTCTWHLMTGDVPIPGLEPEARAGTVGEVIDGRRGVYGEPTSIFPRIAQVWSGILGHHVNAVDVPLMLIGLKAVRSQVCPDYSDNSDDIEGFLDIFRELVGDDMIQARLVSEYLEKKAQR